MNASLLSSDIREAALELGFTRAGVAAAVLPARGRSALARWLAEGMHAGMDYMLRPERTEPRALMPEARSIVAVALAYPRAPLVTAGSPAAAVARYVRAADYHHVFRARLEALAQRCGRLAGGVARYRVCADTAPLLEREAAAAAGVAFIGKSTLAVVPGVGSYVLLGELLLDLELDPTPAAARRCGDCTACLAACPTGALVEPWRLDARRCISYLTIEHRYAIPRELRPLVGVRLFGCDACQEICPYNATRRAAAIVPELREQPGVIRMSLEDLLALGSGAHRRLVAATALRRTGRNQLARNAAVALGNAGERGAVAALARALAEHASPLVRGHAAWALGRLGGAAARLALDRARASDVDPFVREEVSAARGGAQEALRVGG